MNCKNCKNYEDCYIVSGAWDWAYYDYQPGRDFGCEWEPLDGDKRYKEELERLANGCDDYKETK